METKKCTEKGRKTEMYGHKSNESFYYIYIMLTTAKYKTLAYLSL
jgi:hypothetical protein